MHDGTINADNRDHFGNRGHCWHSYPGQMSPMEICCHCGAKRQPLFYRERPEGCGPYAPKVRRQSGYMGVADRFEAVPGMGNMTVGIGADRWKEPCPGDPNVEPEQPTVPGAGVDAETVTPRPGGPVTI